MLTIVSLILGLLVVILITVMTGYFVAQEFAYMAVDRSRLKALAEQGDARAGRALAVTRRTSFMLSGAQLGITVTGLLVGYVAEPLIGESLSTMLGGVGVPTAVSVGVGALAALLIATIIQMLFGELFPKNLAIARPEPMSLGLARSTTVYLALMGWLIAFFDKSANFLLRLLAIQPVHDVDHAASARDLEHIVADSREVGALTSELSIMIDRILEFPQQDVEHAMIPLTRVDCVSSDDTLALLRVRMAEGHSRYPVQDEQTDEIVGVVHLLDLLGTTLPETAPVTAIQRPPLFIPTLMRLPSALAQMQGTRNELACVVDEYGGFAGVLTVEDLAEELVGEITDEHDSEIPTEASSETEGVWLMAGDVHVDEAERTLSVDLPPGDYETVAGLIISHYDGLPEPGETVLIALPRDPAGLAQGDEAGPQHLQVEILEVRNHVPSQVRMCLRSQSVDPAADAQGTVQDG